jgi:hypothetical protein
MCPHIRFIDTSQKRVEEFILNHLRTTEIYALGTLPPPDKIRFRYFHSSNIRNSTIAARFFPATLFQTLNV